MKAFCTSLAQIQERPFQAWEVCDIPVSDFYSSAKDQVFLTAWHTISAFGHTLELFPQTALPVLNILVFFFSQAYPWGQPVNIRNSEGSSCPAHALSSPSLPVLVPCSFSRFPKHLRKLVQRPALPALSSDNAPLVTDDTHVGAKPVIFTLSQQAQCSCHNLSVVGAERFVVGVKIFFCYRVRRV